MLALTDTHCHLDLEQFDSDRDAVLDRARAAGVNRIMNPGIDLATSRRAVALAAAQPEVYAAVGFHPHEAAGLGPAELAELRQLAQHPKVKAIGEIGLDYYRNLAPRAAQHTAFRRQLDLAADLDLPVIVHCREAHADVLTMLAEWAGQTENARGVLHSYSGAREQLGQPLALGLAIGLTGPITFPNGDSMRYVAQSAPLDRLLIETDAPYLSPVPRRGRRNEPAHVRYVAEKIAEVRQESFEMITTQTSLNAKLLFNWGE